MVDYFLFLLYKLFKFVVLLVPKKLVKLFLDGVINLAYKFNKEHKKYAKANLDFIYNNKISEDRKNEIIKNSYKNLIYNLYEFIENQTLDLKGFERKIKVENESFITDAIKNNRKIILVTAHYGNWEYGNNFIPLKYGPTTMVGRPMNNKYLNEELDDTRTKNGTQMLSKSNASRGLVKALKDNRIIGLVVDQHNRTGIDVDFFGHKVKQTDSAARLALKFDALIIPLFFTMDSFGKYTAKFYEPIDPKEFNSDDDILKLTQIQANIIEKHILNNPDQWFWQHKRFKFYNNEIYKNNRKRII
ncbi:MAG: lipid A biosynthesis lauroyl acyltransferase [Campylobacterota bacterium]|nr:lipid A biosynthesis lauroyl acyltransferase [Campylobacterota bacterium]